MNFQKIKDICRKVIKVLSVFRDKVGKIGSSLLRIDFRNINLQKVNLGKITALKDSEKFKQVAVFGIGVVLALAAGFTFVSRNSQTPISVATKISDNAAEAYFYSGNYNKAIEEYLNLSSQDEQTPLWYLKVSEIYSVMGDIENSKKYIDLAKALRAKNIEADVNKSEKDYGIKDSDNLNYIAFTELMNKDYKDALKDGEEALGQYPGNQKIIKTMITVYMANSQTEKAKNLVNSYPMAYKSAYDIAEFARLRILLDQWDEGLEALKTAWTVDKDEYKIYDLLAQIAAYNKDKLLEKITALSAKYPEETVYKMWLAKIYSMSEDTSEQASKILDEIKDQNVGNIEKVLIEASVLQNMKQSEKADELMNTLIKDNENDYRVLHTAAWYYLNKNEADKALDYCKKSILKNKNYPDNYGFLMPEILKAMGKGDEGEAYFRTALLKEPYNYNIMITLANFYWYTTKNSDKAMEYFKLAEIVKPNDGEIKYNMALIDITNEKMDDAVSILQQCIKIDDAVPKYHRTLGTIYLLKGKLDEGIKEVRYAYAADKEDILTLNNAGCYYITSGTDIERGEYNLRKAYEGINPSVDEFTKNTITDNYNKAKKLLDDYNAGKGNEVLKVPDFILFY